MGLSPMIPREGEWAMRSRRVFTPTVVRPAAVIVNGEQIAAVVEPDTVPAGMPVEDVGDKYLLPGLIDSHVHINEPGRTEWEGFETATRAAIAGGVTTLIDMPLNSSPVTKSVESLRTKQAATAGQLWADCGFHAGIVPGNADQVRPLIAAGVCGFKTFLCHSGIDEFPNATESDLRRVMPILAAAGVPLLVHAEMVAPLSATVEQQFADQPWGYAHWLAMRPPEWEVAAIGMMIRLCREYRCHIHIVHLSASIEAADLILAARAEGLPLTIETCPHYLYFTAEGVPNGDPRYKCAPPIRSGQHREHLRVLVRAGVIDTIGSDHSPAPPGLKHLDDGDLKLAWGGIASLQLLLPAIWTSITNECVFSAMTSRPAALVGIAGRKGSIAPGFDADLVVFDPNAEFVVSAKLLQHRHKWSPYDGQRLRGVVESTFLRGRKVYNNGVFLDKPRGQIILRQPKTS
jgi:allantoinase